MLFAEKILWRHNYRDEKTPFGSPACHTWARIRGSGFAPGRLRHAKQSPRFWVLVPFNPACNACCRSQENKRNPHTQQGSSFYAVRTLPRKEWKGEEDWTDKQTREGKEKQNKKEICRASHSPMGTMIPPSLSAWVRHSHNDKNPPGIPSRVFAP